MSLVLFSRKVDASQHGLELIDYLIQCQPKQSRAFWERDLLAGHISLDGEIILHSHPIQCGQIVGYQQTDYQEPKLNCDWHLLWQNEKLLAIHKPAELPVSRTTRNTTQTLVHQVQIHSPWNDAHLLHRLDKETSGIILLAKNKLAAQHWQPQLKHLMKRKTYRAIVHGVPSWQQIELCNQLATRGDSAIRCQMYVTSKHERAKQAISRFRQLEYSDHFALIECEIETGRKHQIRAHLAHLGHPIVGDKIYAHDGYFFLKRCEVGLDEQDLLQLASPHHLLHAYRLEIECPEKISLCDEMLPQSWRDFYQSHHWLSSTSE